MIKGFFIVDIRLQVQIVFILTKKKKKNRIILAPAVAFSFYRPCQVEDLVHITLFAPTHSKSFTTSFLHIYPNKSKS